MTGQYRLEIRGGAVGQSKLPLVEQLTQEFILIGEGPSNDAVKHLSDVAMYSYIKWGIEPKVFAIPVSSVWRGGNWVSWRHKLQFMFESCVF